MTQWKKRTIAVLLSVFMVLTMGFWAGLPVSALSSGSLQVTPDSAVIYDTEEWAKECGLEIPSDYPQSIQLSISGVSSYTCRVIQGDSVEVSSTGLITPKYTIYYWNGNVGTPIPTGKPGEREEITPNFGESVVRVQSGSSYVDISVTFADYANLYANQVMEDYLDQTITDTMTVREKLEYICQFVASYDYSPYYQSYAGMIVSGGGDCWASTNTIIAMCEKLGIHAWSRNGNKDPGAGSGHMNAMVEGDGTYYEADAGYSGTAPRHYSITQRSALFSYTIVDGGIELYQYDGERGATQVLEIPEEIDGRKVVGLGESFLTLDNTIIQVILPDTLTYLKQSAFNSCSALTTLNIPAGVTSIGDFVFTGDTALVNFTCDSDNPSYTIVDGVLYSKDMTTVVSVPAAQSVALPDSVTTIGGYSFYYNTNLTQVTMGDGVTTIGEGAFGNCSALTQVRLSEGLRELGAFAFRSCGKLNQLILPESLETIGDYLLMYSSPQLYGWEGSAAAEFAEENGLTLNILEVSGGRYDQNRDGAFSVLDVMTLAQAVVSGKTDSRDNLNGDSVVNVLDVMALATAVVS